MLTDLLAHRIVEEGDKGEEFEDEGMDIDDAIERIAAGEDWEDVITDG